MRNWLQFLITAFAFSVATPPLAAQTRPATASDTVRLSLSDAVRRADRLGEEVRIARANVNATGAQVTIARSAGLPHIGLNATENRTVASARGQAVGSVFNQPYTYNTSISGSQSLFQGGRIVNGVRAANAVTAASQQDLAEARSVTDLQTQSAYLNVLFTNRVVQIQRQAYDQAAARARQAEQFQQAGRFSRYDVLRARVELANIEPQLLQAQENAQIALLELRRLTNVPTAQPLALTTTIDSTAIRDVLATVDTTVGPEKRPALQSAAQIARARQLGISVARAALLPSVSFNFNTGYSAFPVGGSAFPSGLGGLAVVPCAAGTDPTRVCTSQNGGFFSDRSFGFLVSWPIFDGLQNKGAIDLAGAQARLAEAQLEETRERVYNDVARVKTDLTRARTQYDARQQSVGEAAEAFQLATLRFSRGLSTQLEVADAQIALTTAETNEARSLYDVYIAVATLAQAQGRPLPLPSNDHVADTIPPR
ncbi:MAG: TolC family protein [Gemmatimonadaceae bacterium]